MEGEEEGGLGESDTWRVLWIMQNLAAMTVNSTKASSFLQTMPAQK